MFNPKNVSRKPKNSEFLIFNTIMSENKKTPTDLTIPSPAYFRDLKYIEERNHLLDACLLYAFGNKDYDEDIEQNPYEPPSLNEDDKYTHIEVIKIIQKNELGRQGRERYIQSYLSNVISKKKDSNVDDA